MATLKNTTVPNLTSTNAASSANHVVRKAEYDANNTAIAASIALKLASTDASVTNARTPTGTATGGEITGTYPNSLVVADRTINQALATPVNTGPITSLFSWLAGMIKAITGETNWSDPPDTTLSTAAAHIASTSNPHTVTKGQVGLTNVSDDAQLKIASNLSDVASAATSRTNLGLGNSATLAVGTTTGTVAAGDDSRLTNARTPSAHAATHKLAGSDPILLHEFGLPTSSVNLNSQKITNLLIPSTDADASTKAYVDSHKSAFKVRVAALSNAALTGLYTLDGVALIAGDRVAAVDQESGLNNGIWVAAAGAWARAADADQGSKLSDGSLIVVGEGTVGAGTVWMLTTNNPITLNVTSLTFVQWPEAGSGLTWSGTALSAGTGAITDAHLGSRTGDPALASPASTGTLTQLFGWIMGRLKAFSGETNWYDAPDTTLALAATHIASTANPHTVTADQVGLGLITNSVKLVAASNLSDLASAATARTNLGLLGSSILAVGTTSGTVAAGDDSRFQVKTGKVVWVDGVNGVDATGVRGRLDKPFLTCTAAKAAATTGDTIYVLPGTYDDRNLLKHLVNWYFLPGANVSYTGSANGGIFDDGIYGTNGTVTCRITAHGYFQNGSGGIDPSVLTVSSAISIIYFTGIDVTSDNGTALLLKSGLSYVTLSGKSIGEMGINVQGGFHYLNLDWATGDSSHGIYCQGGTSTIQIDAVSSTSGDGVRFKDGTHEISARSITSAGGPGVRIEAPAGAQIAKVSDAFIKSTLNTAAGVAVKLESSNLKLQGVVMVSNIAGTPATVSIDAGSALNVKVYGHAMANLAKHANVTLLCGTLEVDADVT